MSGRRRRPHTRHGPPFRGHATAGRSASRERTERGGPPAGGPGSSYDADARREEAPDSLPDAPSCPFCDGDETEIMSAFGAHASVSTYWCRACRSPFDLMKWRGGA